MLVKCNKLGFYGGMVGGLECYKIINKANLALIIIYYDFLCIVDPTDIKLYTKDYQFKSSYAALKGSNYVYG